MDDYQVGDTVYDEDGYPGIILDITYGRDFERYEVEWQDGDIEWMDREDIYPN